MRCFLRDFCVVGGCDFFLCCGIGGVVGYGFIYLIVDCIGLWVGKFGYCVLG